LAEEILKVGNVGIDGDKPTASQLVSGLVVAAVDGAVAATAILAGHVGGNGNGDSGKSEDDSLSEHLEGLLMGWLWIE
jgi:hypothetical protein